VARCVQESGHFGCQGKKAIGQAEGLAELMVFYCEWATGFSNDVGLQDEGYFDALLRMWTNLEPEFAAFIRTLRLSD